MKLPSVGLLRLLINRMLEASPRCLVTIPGGVKGNFGTPSEAFIIAVPDSSEKNMLVKLGRRFLLT